MAEESSEKLLKIVLVGGPGTGKSSLATRYTQDTFDKLYQQTVGLDFFMKRITLPGNTHVTLQIWDTGSQTLLSQMVDKYIFGAQAVVLVYDITNFDSFEALHDWLNVIHRVHSAALSLPILALVANKCDLEHMRSVKQDRHANLAHECGMSSHWVSAKTGESVNLCFQKIACDVLGIKLSRSEQETVQPIVKAEIVQYVNAADLTKAQPKCHKTAVCSVQ